MLEIKNILIELKNSFEGLIYQINTIKERINENEKSSISITEIKTKEQNSGKERKHSIIPLQINSNDLK